MGIGKSTKKKMLRRLGAQKLAKMVKMGRGRGEGRSCPIDKKKVGQEERAAGNNQ
jgi:hypothetical protein